MQKSYEIGSFNAREYIGANVLLKAPHKLDKVVKNRPSAGVLYPTPTDGWEGQQAYVSGRIDAEGYGAIGAIPLVAVSRAEKEENNDRNLYETFTCTRWHYEEGEVVVEVVPASASNRFISCSESPQQPEGVQVPTKKYGLKGMTPYGTRRVRQGAAILERRYGKNLGLYTLTIPSLGRELCAQVSRNWSKLMNHFFTLLGRKFAACGMKFSYVAVYEIQGKRLEKRGEYALHTHYLCPAYAENSSGRRFIVTADELREMWFAVLRAELLWSDASLEKVKASVDSSLVRSSAGAYIAKYLSKGSEDVERLVDCGLEDCIPPQWWSCSKSIRAALKIWERKLLPEELDDLCYLCSRSEYHADMFDYCHRVYADINGYQRCVGYSFKLRKGNPLYNFDELLRNLDKTIPLLV